MYTNPPPLFGSDGVHPKEERVGERLGIKARGGGRERFRLGMKGRGREGAKEDTDKGKEEGERERGKGKRSERKQKRLEKKDGDQERQNTSGTSGREREGAKEAKGKKPLQRYP